METSILSLLNRTTAIVLAAGSGKRMQSDVAKQFIELAGKPLICYSLDVFEASVLIDDIILVSNEEGMETCKNIVSEYGYTKVSSIVVGGKERYNSVWNGLQAAKSDNPPNYVLIHDGARPFVDEEILKRNLDALQNYKACVTGMPSKDTVKIADEDGLVKETPNRAFVWNIQTPQSFSFELVYEAYGKLVQSEEEVLLGGIGITDDAMVVETYTGVPVKLVEGSYKNMKITTPEDLPVAEGLLVAEGED